MPDPLTSAIPSDATVAGVHPSFRSFTSDDGETDYEPTDHYLPNMAIEMLNRDATRVLAARGVQDVVIHDGLTTLDVDGRPVPGLADGMAYIEIHFDPHHPEPALMIGHRIASAEADLRETMGVPDGPFLPTLADVIGAVHTCFDDADLAMTLPFPYLDAVQYGNQLFVQAGDGTGGIGGHYRLVVERITAEQFQAMQYVLGSPEATDDEVDADG